MNAFSVLADNDRRKEGKKQEGGTEHHREEKRERLAAVGERLEEGRRAGAGHRDR